MPTQVRKVLFNSFGGPEVVQIVHSTLPDPSAQHVQVKIIYSGFSGTDVNMRLGKYPFQKKAPLTPGYCFVGRVHLNGPQSKRFAVGDLVACMSVYDAESTYVNQPEKHLVPIPHNLDLKVATALILDWNTAYGMLKGRHWQGKKVFIHGMSGAVGNALVELCKREGATVYGTASARNHQTLVDMDCHPYDYRNKTWIKAMQDVGGVDGVFDPLGFASFDESYSILNPNGGVLFGYGQNSGTLTGTVPSQWVWWPIIKLLLRGLKFWSGKSTVFYYIDRATSSFQTNLEELFQMALKGDIHVSLKKVFDMDEVVSVHQNWTRLEGMGSVVMKVSDE
jgi:NADPH:quinone reductase-like Zn-dependent oxidoreductase